ncbi:McrB family protein [Variovorax boronicumulans]|uniref:McrB family protein n=1 Tax=Variovorax boronicumulans TaxID=436515 RepID=UPI0012E49F8B|nr:AAA family ATPase [Variovorax boronicumulans]GER21417.1 hypothetical protein VCH24_64690 [Variovorax boronicumulans]
MNSPEAHIQRDDEANWSQFLALWPKERLKSLRLNEYTAAGSTETFTYWIEYRLKELGSIKGGSNFKMGIFSRGSDGDGTDQKPWLRYTPEYGWYAKYGDTPEQAFEAIRQRLVAIAEAAAISDLDAIRHVDFGLAVKWKIAFLYQDRARPSIVAVFSRRVLGAFLNRPMKNSEPLASIYPEILSLKRSDEGILELGHRVWESKPAAARNIEIFKLSMSDNTFSGQELETLARQQLVVAGRVMGGGQGDSFPKTEVGTLFYLCYGNSVQLIGRLTSEAEATPKGEDYAQRHYEILFRASRHDPFTANQEKWTPRGISTFWQVPPHRLSEFEQLLLRPYFGINLEDLAEVESMELNSELPLRDATMSRPSVPLQPLNRILYGPPGTGKTYRSVAEAVSIAEGGAISELLVPDRYIQTKARFDELRRTGQVEFLTFHPSYAYQDFVQGIRPRAVGGSVSYDVVDGVLKRIADKAMENWHKSQASAVLEITEEARFERAFYKVSESIQDKGFVEAQLAGGRTARVTIPTREGGLTVQTEGSETAYTLSKKRIRSTWMSRGSISRVRDIKLPVATYFWAVLQLLKQVDQDLEPLAAIQPEPLRQFVLVIDEINRGNIAKIFGELITLIEDDKRVGGSNELTVTLPYAEADDPPFGLPPNLHLVGTMNTADRSIALMDTALRRRFAFVELMPDLNAVPSGSIDGVEPRRLLEAINARIRFLFDREHTIGHAYLCGVNSLKDVERALTERIIPLLQEYFHDDWAKISLVLNGRSTDSDLCIVESDEIGAEELFGSNADNLADMTTFRIRTEISAEMVRAIYA